MAKKRRSVSTKVQLAGLAVLAVVTLGVVGYTVTKPDATVTLTPQVANYTPPPVNLPQAPKLPDIPAGSQVLLIGDSYALGTGATDRESGRYGAILSAMFQWNTTIDGIGGTGFTWGGGADGTANNQYINRITAHAANPEMKPRLVILQGGQNDHRAKPEDLQAATGTAVTAVKTAWPEAAVLVVGPTAPQPLAAKLGRMATPIAAGATEAGAFSLNPIREKWFTNENSPGFDYDKSHVNDAGHKYMAEQIVNGIKRLQS